MSFRLELWSAIFPPGYAATGRRERLLTSKPSVLGFYSSSCQHLGVLSYPFLLLKLVVLKLLSSSKHATQEFLEGLEIIADDNLSTVCYSLSKFTTYLRKTDMNLYISSMDLLGRYTRFLNYISTKMAHQWQEIASRTLSNTLKVSVTVLAEDNSKCFLDVRRMFSRGVELLPTKRGVRTLISADDIGVLRSAIEDVISLKSLQETVLGIYLRRRVGTLSFSKAQLEGEVSGATKRLLLNREETSFIIECLNDFENIVRVQEVIAGDVGGDEDAEDVEGWIPWL